MGLKGVLMDDLPQNLKRGSDTRNSHQSSICLTYLTCLTFLDEISLAEFFEMKEANQGLAKYLSKNQYYRSDRSEGQTKPTITAISAV